MSPPLRRGWRIPAAAAILLVALALAGCATPQLAALQQQWPGQLPPSALVTQVPFFAQDDHLCGPASLAMVAQAAGSRVSAAELTPQVYLPGRQGALQQEMLAAARRQGLVAYPLAPRLEGVLREVAAGQPVLVLQNLGLSISPLWHYAVVIGYDRGQGEVILHSGTTARMRMPLTTFEHTWARSSHWSVRVTSPSRLPVTAEPDAWAAAVAALERTDARAAQEGYASGLRRWPGHRTLLLGSGNAAYALGERERAAAAYEAATRSHPDFADAWNNLAQVRLDLGQPRAARAAIERAVALGGPRLSMYQALQRKIEGK